jgi:hypothetical protein
VHQNYPLDLFDFRRSDLEDGVMQFSAGRPAAPRQPERAARTVGARAAQPQSYVR